MGKLTLSSAVGKKNSHDVSGSKLGTADFGMIIPSHVFPLQMGDTLKTDFGQTTQMDSLPLPTFSRLRLRHMAIWVPMRVIDHSYNSYREFLHQQDGSLNSDFSGALYKGITNRDLVEGILSFTQAAVGTNKALVVSGGTLDHYDVGYNPNGTSDLSQYVYYTFTDRGRYIMNILESLGYKLNFAYSDDTPLDLSVLWAYARFFYDFVYPSQWVQSQGFGHLFYKSDTLSVLQNAISYNQNSRSIWDIFVVPFEKSFYTSAWLSSNSPNGSIPLPNPSNQNAASSVDNALVINSSADIPFVSQNLATQKSTLSSYALRKLMAVSDFVTRNNLAGSRFFERVKARYGYVTQQVKSEYSQLVKTWMDEVDINSVIATADSQINGSGSGTVTTLLGDKGGYGGSFSTGHSIKFSADEDGYLIFAYMFVPSIGYVQGRKPWTMGKVNIYDWYTPEMDGVGMMPVRNDSLFAEFINPTLYAAGQEYGGNPSGIFGFQFSYADRKIGHDYLCGDFNRHNINGSHWMDAYHTFRLLPPPGNTSPGTPQTESTTQPLVLNSNFLLQHIYGQFNRIFNVDSSTNFVYGQDHFITFFHFNAIRIDNMKSISESIPFFDKHGDDVSISMNGESLG